MYGYVPKLLVIFLALLSLAPSSNLENRSTLDHFVSENVAVIQVGNHNANIPTEDYPRKNGRPLSKYPVTPEVMQVLETLNEGRQRIVLDVGAGFATASIELAEKGSYKVVAINAQNMLENTVRTQQLVESGAFEYRVADADSVLREFKTSDKRIAVIFDAFGKFTYDTDPIETIRTYYRILPPDGIAAIFVTHQINNGYAPSAESVILDKGKYENVIEYLVELFPSVFKLHKMSVLYGDRVEVETVLTIKKDLNIDLVKLLPRSLYQLTRDFGKEKEKHKGLVFTQNIYSGLNRCSILLQRLQL